MRFSTLGYSIKQGVKNIWRNKMFSLASIATMGACIFLFGIFFAVVINFNYIVKNAETDVSMTVFFNEDADQATIDEIGTEIRAKTDVVKECKYVSADETWENFAKQYFEGKEEYKDGFKPNDNPLATSAHYEVYVYQVETQDALAEYIRSLDGVREVKQAEGATTTLTTMNRVIGYVSIAIILILLAVSCFPDQQYRHDWYFGPERGDRYHEADRCDEPVCKGSVPDRGYPDRTCRSSDSAGTAVRGIQQSHQLRYDGVQRTVELYGIHAGIGRLPDSASGRTHSRYGNRTCRQYLYDSKTLESLIGLDNIMK